MIVYIYVSVLLKLDAFVCQITTAKLPPVLLPLFKSFQAHERVRNIGKMEFIFAFGKVYGDNYLINVMMLLFLLILKDQLDCVKDFIENFSFLNNLSLLFFLFSDHGNSSFLHSFVFLQEKGSKAHFGFVNNGSTTR